MKKIKNIINKYIEFIITKIKLVWEQRIETFDNIKVKYILKRDRDSEVLVIVFSACTRNGIKARYNYVRTLNGIKCTRLYILDDYAEDHRGSYYMGYNCNFKEELAVKKLIDKIIHEYSYQKIVFCGSSKGGYSALNFGLSYENSIMVVGAPQYYLTTYLKASGNLAALRHIIGEPTKEKEDIIEFYLKNKILGDKYIKSQNVYFHYSDKEHTYEEHVRDLIKDMEDAGLKIQKDILDYTNHSEISLYFPYYLKTCITNIVNDLPDRENI